ncbi:hypothetical protein [Streptomyces sp. MK7]|uniref:hypothetical protein n=1 Tax=Streptomyces sp. MK7 TaxID=3067635 RepID=UPI0029310BBA|nr:hypothetical protein [Streptomyces sp. MK7]
MTWCGRASHRDHAGRSQFVFGCPLAAFAQAGNELRAKEVREMPGTGTEPRHTESNRAKPKRLVDRDIRAEPEPGPSTLTHPAPATPDTNSS